MRTQNSQENHPVFCTINLLSSMEWNVLPKVEKNFTVLSMTFSTKQDYDKAFKNPFPMAVEADSQGVNEIRAFIEGQQHPVLRLKVQNVIRLGHRVGAI